MPELQHGTSISFWEDELRMDLAQEHALACLEGRNPTAAVVAYRRREREWRFMTHYPILEEIHPDEAFD